MADYSIRKYNKGDYEAVRDLFAQGMLEYIPGTTSYMLKLPQVYCPILASSIILQLFFQSFFLSLLGVGIAVAAVHLILTFACKKLIKQCHNGDLRNVQETYIWKPNSCFWVAESGGRIVGMVGAQPAPNSNNDMTLRRLSVARDQQRRGIAKALCTTVFDFARHRGYKRVVLDTSTFQFTAHKLYQKLGFTIKKIIPSKSRLGRFAKMSVVFYSYDF
ncbi:PREDICTED: probable N-acetyltransferase camello [Nanorana parkeri]|uniref:probable N-acetyltransferase camello n=1 Tax=Nanorana parkeri TaxID=125878 RepID=UPI0008547AD8|nr:PREDICTED: probable N-acetyltransferase camello [Nanorana parkeri]XP_018426274.1 PREDICTED: probable N-acetyltransferase camello [Nanorana parkeri]